MSHWTELKPRKALIPWRRWRTLARLWRERSRRKQIARNEARLRSIRMMRRMSRGGTIRK